MKLRLNHSDDFGDFDEVVLNEVSASIGVGLEALWRPSLEGRKRYLQGLYEAVLPANYPATNPSSDYP